MALAGVLAFRRRQSRQIGPNPRTSVADALAADDLLDSKATDGDHAHDHDRRRSGEEKEGSGAPDSMVSKNPLYARGGGGFGAAVSVSSVRMS